MRSVVITGGNGFVGRYLVAELQKNWPGVKIVVWDKTLEGLPASVAGVEVDVTKPETYRQSLEEVKPDWIVHLAAIAAIGVALTSAELTRRVNVEGTRHLLESVRELSTHTKVFVVSSADIYGAKSDKPLSEMGLSECKPPNPYAVSKWEMEKMIEAEFNDLVLRVRPFNHIGPKQAKGFVTADFASQIAAAEVGKQESVIRVGNLTAKRDFTDVRDVVRAYRLLMAKGKLGEVYNVASGKGVAIQALLDKLLALAKVAITVKQDPQRLRPSDTPVVVGDAGKLRAATGWQPQIPLEQSLREILDYWRDKVRTS